MSKSISLAASAAFLVIAAFSSPVAGQATLIHWYPFDNNVTDEVGTANGTLLNGATVAAGMLSLNASQSHYVQFNQNLVPTTGSFSVAIVAREGARTGTYIELISQGYSGGCGYYIGHAPEGTIRVGDAWLSTGEPYPTDGQWHHFAATVDESASLSKLYIDGTLRRTLPGTICRNVGTTTRFGRQFAPFDEFFDGAIDDVRIYSGALSPAQVAGLAFCSLHKMLQQPVDVISCPSATVSFSVINFESDSFTYQWQWQPAGPATAWVALTDGINLSSQGTPAFDVSGATAAAATIRSIWGLGGDFRCIVTNACGSVTSNPATLTITTACNLADIVSIGGGTAPGGGACPDGLLTGDDFNAFIAAFAADDSLADVVGIGGEPPPDGLVTGDDFNAFIAAFANGCP